MKELLIMAKSLGGGGSEVALIELINALPEELYNITLVLLDSDNEYAYRLKKKVNIVQLTFNCSFAKSLVSMYAFPAKVLKKLSVNSFIPSRMKIFKTSCRMNMTFSSKHNVGVTAICRRNGASLYRSVLWGTVARENVWKDSLFRMPRRICGTRKNPY